MADWTPDEMLRALYVSGSDIANIGYTPEEVSEATQRRAAIKSGTGDASKGVLGESATQATEAFNTWRTARNKFDFWGADKAKQVGMSDPGWWDPSKRQATSTYVAPQIWSAAQHPAVAAHMNIQHPTPVVHAAPGSGVTTPPPAPTEPSEVGAGQPWYHQGRMAAIQQHNTPFQKVERAPQ